LRLVAELGGKLGYGGIFESVWIGDSDESWDMVGLMEFPSRKALVDLFLHPDYIAAHEFRHQGVARHKTLISHPGLEDGTPE
jgi:uncharacterized protein (DUF1330 family)